MKKLTTKDKYNINAVIDSKKQNITPEERARALTDLKKKYSYAELGELLGIPQSTIDYYINGHRLKRDSFQKTARQLKKGLFDYDTLITHFQLHLPKSDEERYKIKKLAVVLMDCSKRGYK